MSMSDKELRAKARALGCDLTEFERMSDEQKRLKRLKAKARARGCELHELTTERQYDEDNELELVYWLFILGYQEPVEFDDLDEAEIDINSRPLQRAVGARR